MFCKKVTFWGPKKGTLDRRMLSLKARLGGSTFGIPKNRCVKLPVSSSMCPPPYIPPAKINYFPLRRTDERTNERTDISCFALSNVMALRASFESLYCPAPGELQKICRYHKQREVLQKIPIRKLKLSPFVNLDRPPYLLNCEKQTCVFACPLLVFSLFLCQYVFSVSWLCFTTFRNLIVQNH